MRRPSTPTLSGPLSPLKQPTAEVPATRGRSSAHRSAGSGMPAVRAGLLAASLRSSFGCNTPSAPIRRNCGSPLMLLASYPGAYCAVLCSTSVLPASCASHPAKQANDPPRPEASTDA